MELRQLQSFVAVARQGNVTRAAQDLYLTQSALSQQLRRLEASVGVQLLRRTPRGVELTGAGEELLAHAEAVLAEVARARAALDAHADVTRGLARVVATAADGAAVPAALAAFHAEHPDVRVALRHARAGEAAGLVRRGAADLAVAPAAGGDEAGLEVTPLAPEPLLLITAPGDDPGGEVEVAELRGRSLVLPGPGTALRDAVVAACVAEGFSPVPRFEVDDPATVRLLVAAGLGAGLAPASWLRGPGPEVAVGRLAAPAPQVRLALVSAPEPPSPAAALLADHLRAALG